jgi:four helix bundle protein
MQRFTSLRVWQRGHQFTLGVYGATRAFPRDEAFGLTSQLRRAAVSIPANVAEGSKRRSSKEYAHLLNVAEGSAAETEYLLTLSQDLGYLGRGDAEELIKELRQIAAMPSVLRQRVESSG